MSTIRPEDITNIIGTPIANARKYWPMIVDYLKERKCNTLAFQVAILATMGVENSGLKPVKEYGGAKYYFEMYDKDSPLPRGRRAAKMLGNTEKGDGARFCGRGPVQLTGRHNYLVYGKKIGVDLIANPEAALDDANAPRIIVEYLLDHGVAVWADRAFRTDDDALYPEEMCKVKIRKLVNGGLTHYEKFSKFWDKFEAIARA